MRELDQALVHESTWYEEGVIDAGPMGMSALSAFVGVWRETPMPPPEHQRWLAGDHESLNRAFHLESYVRTNGLPPDAPPAVRSELDEYVAQWRSALPFTEVERGVILGVLRSPEFLVAPRGAAYKYELARLTRQEEVEIVDGGLRRAVKGRDLLRQWVMWSRGAGEYASGDGINQARVALRDLAGRLVAPSRMPAVYYDLQGMERPVPYRSSPTPTGSYRRSSQALSV